MAPQAICLVTSSSRGNKLLFYDKGRPLKGNCSTVVILTNDVLYTVADGVSDVLR